jgi:hypothetical protein
MKYSDSSTSSVTLKTSSPLTSQELLKVKLPSSGSSSYTPIGKHVRLDVVTAFVGTSSVRSTTGGVFSVVMQCVFSVERARKRH